LTGRLQTGRSADPMPSITEFALDPFRDVRSGDMALVAPGGARSAIRL